MDTTVTEKNYPIRLEWVLKFFGLVVLIGLSLIFLSRIGVNLGPGPDPRLLTLLLVIAGVVPVTNALLWRAAFHYSLGSQSLVVRQGILSTQELSIPYGVIWDVTIHRDVFDRLVGLATLTIKSVPRDQDDNIEAARPSLLLWPFMSRMGRVYAFVPQSRAPQLGFYGNTLRIAGLSVSDAETLKEMLLQKKTVSSGIGA